MELKFVEKGMLCHKYASLILVDRAFIRGEMEIADSKHPYYIKYSNNVEEFHAVDALKNFKGAECIKTWTRGDYCDDPYGRPYRMGTIDCSIWDLRKAFGITEPLENFLSYETKAFLRGETNTLM